MRYGTPVFLQKLLVISALVVPVNCSSEPFSPSQQLLLFRKKWFLHSVIVASQRLGCSQSLSFPSLCSLVGFLFYITSAFQQRQGTSLVGQNRVWNRYTTKMWGGICEHGEAGGRGSMASLEGLGAGSVMEHFLPCGWIHFSKVPLCTEPFVSTLFLLNKKGELYYCANESSRQRQILPRFLLISKSYGASEVPEKLTYSLRQL